MLVGIRYTKSSTLLVFSVNLMAGLGTLAAIARQRPAFMSTVVQAFESLHGKAIDNYLLNIL